VIAGFVLSSIMFATGAILDFALTTTPYQHGFDVRTIGVILMIVGAVGAGLSLLGGTFGGTWRKHRTIVDDGRGNVMRREDTYT
jgi:hypothetical protein